MISMDGREVMRRKAQQEAQDKWFWANFRQYPCQQLLHAATGFLGLTLGYFLSPIFLAIIGVSCWRQYCEYLKRHDTPGYDLAWVLIGCYWAMAFIAGYVAWPPSGWVIHLPAFL